MKILYILISFIININIFIVSIGLDDVDPEDINYISSIAVHKSRAFLALPRSVCFNKKSNPTLIETHWDGGYGDIFSRFLQKITKPKILSSRVWGDCDSIQDAISLSMEPFNPKLWILDKGSDVCNPKILSFDTVFNRFVDKMELTNMEQRNLNTMVIDPIFESDFGHRAYIGQAEENVLLVFSLKNLIWWKIRLTVTTIPAMLVNPDYLAISESTPDLFITGIEGAGVFSLNLEQLRKMEEPDQAEAQDDPLSLNVTFHGEKLGPSTGIVSDKNSGLVYFMKKYHALLRWDTGFPLVAEHHIVLAQSYEMFPYVSGFFTDPDDGIWAIVNPKSPDDCINVTETSKLPLELENRVIRIIKYDKVKEEIEIDDNLQEE